MDTKIIVANWKSNKTAAEAVDFFTYFSEGLHNISTEHTEIVICPSFSLLPSCAEYIAKHNLPLYLGAQNISEFGKGAYTGEVAGFQIKEYAEYVIIGHSERRRYLNETKERIENKLREAKQAGLTPILCIQDENDFIQKDVAIIAYEPPSAISTFGVGKPDNPENVARVISMLRQKTTARLLYGGSVDNQNVNSYTNIEHLAGFLVGGASLDPHSFLKLLSQC